MSTHEDRVGDMIDIRDDLHAVPDDPRAVPDDPRAVAADLRALAAADDAWASVTACPHGPLLVRGDVEILLADGRPAPRRRATVALCRCGASGIKPFCDGSHKVIGFRTDDEAATG